MDLEAERRLERRSRIVAVAVAFVLHVGFVLSIPAVRDSIEIAITGEGMLEEEEPEEQKPPEPEPPPPEPVRPQRRAENVPPPAAPPPPSPQEPPPAAPPPMFDDVLTSTSNTGSSDTVQQTPPGGVAGGVRGGQEGGTVGGTPEGVVGGTGPLTGANLTRRASPPSGLTNAALLRHYPLGARRMGTTGRVVVNISISADGRVRSVTTRRETPPGLGFAQACRETVMEFGSGWSPGLDARGNPGLSSTSFSCTFDTTQ